MVKLWIDRVVVNVSGALVQVIGGRSVWERDLVNINGSATCRPESGLFAIFHVLGWEHEEPQY